MKTLEMNNPVYFDCDGTLIRDALPNERVCVTLIQHPYRGNAPVGKVKMNANINLLKDMNERGRTVVVWSQAGWLWADAVIRALELQNFVHYVLEKPIAYVDDLHASEFMTQRIFLND